MDIKIFQRFLDKLHFKYIRNLEADELFEIFLISAVSSILVIRFYLTLTNYPQLAWGNYHLAHMLWGGLFMVVAQVMLLSFLDKSSRKAAAVIGGVGFGTFIDELGKYITADNNYFFQPTFSLIYIIFIFIYLFYKFTIERTKATTDERLINATEIIKQAIISGITPKEKSHALRMLDKIGDSNEIAPLLKNVLERIEPVNIILPGRLTNFWYKLNEGYHLLIKTAWFDVLITVVFVTQSFIAPLMYSEIYHNLIDSFKGKNAEMSLLNVWIVIFTILAIILSIVGAVSLRKSKIYAYRMFKYSILVTVFLVQFIGFYENPVFGFFWLLLNLILLITLNNFLSNEKLHEE